MHGSDGNNEKEQSIRKKLFIMRPILNTRELNNGRRQVLSYKIHTKSHHFNTKYNHMSTKVWPITKQTQQKSYVS